MNESRQLWHENSQCVKECKRILLSAALVWGNMGWLRLVGSLQLEVSLAEYHLFYGALLQERPTIWRSLLIVATPYESLVHMCEAISESGRMWMNHGPYEWVTSHVIASWMAMQNPSTHVSGNINESCRTWMSHGRCEWVMLVDIHESSHGPCAWVPLHMIASYIAMQQASTHMCGNINESSRTRMSHGRHGWVMSHMNATQRATQEFDTCVWQYK